MRPWRWFVQPMTLHETGERATIDAQDAADGTMRDVFTQQFLCIVSSRQYCPASVNSSASIEYGASPRATSCDRYNAGMPHYVTEEVRGMFQCEADSPFVAPRRHEQAGIPSWPEATVAGP